MKVVSNPLQSLALLFFFTSFLGLVACDRGGTVNYRGLRCAPDHNPISLNPASDPNGSSFSKVELEAQNGDIDPQDLLPAGSYLLRSADVFYHDQNNQIMVHYRNITDSDLASASSSRLPTGRCVSGFKPGMEQPSVALLGVREMVFTEDGQFLDLELAEYGFLGLDGDLQSFFSRVSNEGFDHPSQLYDPSSNPEVKYFRATDRGQEPHYEIRSKITLSPGVEVSLLVRLDLQP